MRAWRHEIKLDQFNHRRVGPCFPHGERGNCESWCGPAPGPRCPRRPHQLSPVDDGGWTEGSDDEDSEIRQADKNRDIDADQFAASEQIAPIMLKRRCH